MLRGYGTSFDDVKFACTTFFSLLVGCAQTAPRVPLTVIVRGDSVEVARARAALASAPPDGVEIRSADLSTPLAPTEGPNIEATLDQVRAAYDAPSWQKCIAPIEDASLVSKLLAANKRDGAGRVLFWRTACLLLK